MSPVRWDVLSGSTAAKERARSYAAIVSSEAVAQKIKQNNPELSLSTGQIRSSLTATAGDNAALITVNAKASSPKNAQVLANSALQATADYIKEIEQNPGNAQALVNGENTGASPTGGNTVRVIPLNNASVNPPAGGSELPAERTRWCRCWPGAGVPGYLPAPRAGSAHPHPVTTLPSNRRKHPGCSARQ